MSTIALIQNQTYLSYASKTDVRHHLKALGYDVLLYTAQNIQKLKHDLQYEPIDAIVFSSNCLNENTIKEELFADGFQTVLHTFLQKGKGMLVLHQMRLAEDGVKNAQGGTYDMLPAPFRSVRAVKRVHEPTVSGDIQVSPLASAHQALSFPNSVDLPALKYHCIQKKGLYWHYLVDVDQTFWDVILSDESVGSSMRPLVIANKENLPYRIVISCLNLDWQKEEAFLGNLLHYIIWGRCRTALLQDGQVSSMSFNFFLSTLQSNRIPFHLYDIADKQQVEQFYQRVERGIHTIAILGPCGHEGQQQATSIRRFLQHRAENGSLRFFGIEPEFGRFYVAGWEKLSSKMLYQVEMNLQHDVKQRGFVDGSFWNTVETLKTVTTMAETRSQFDLSTVARLFQQIQTSVRTDGSFDHNFSPTVALLWLHAHYLGPDDERTRKTLQWIGSAVDGEDFREQVLAYTTIIAYGLESGTERKRLAECITSQIDNGELANEIDLAYMLNATLLLNRTDLTQRCVAQLFSLFRQRADGCWLDLSTSATIVNLLLEAMERLAGIEDAERIQRDIEEMVFSTILFIQSSLDETGKNGWTYPWDNKAMTTLKCMDALQKFEELLDFPLSELLKSQLGYTQEGNQREYNRKALDIIEFFKQEAEKVSHLNDDLNEKLDEFRQHQEQQQRQQLRFEQEQAESQAELQALKRTNQRLQLGVQNIKRYQLFLKSAIVSFVIFALLIVWGIIFFTADQAAFAQAVAFIKANKDFIYPSFGLVPVTLVLVSKLFSAKEDERQE